VADPERRTAGGVPDSLALHEALESLDVSNNRLSALPAAFMEAPSTARIENSPLRNLKLSSNLFAVRSGWLHKVVDETRNERPH
jgi:Leucine-rich repeat (LRR) protein